MRPFFIAAANSLVDGDAKNATVCGLVKRRLWPSAHLRVVCCFFMLDDQDTHSSVPYIMSLPLKVQRSRSVIQLREKHSTREKNWALKEKRAGPSHKPHPKATCPHPTRPLRPPGRRARHDYAQVANKMQPKLYVFSGVRWTDFSSAF
jgi:hypothetical protein